MKNDGKKGFLPRDLLHMDGLCENVDGEIPDFSKILPFSQSMVRELGVYRDRITPEMEESL